MSSATSITAVKTPWIAELADGAVGMPQFPEVLIDDIQWRIAEGDYWIVGGSSGSGKSGLLATLAGLQRPIRGVLRLFGRDISSLRDPELTATRLRIGLVFENGSRLFHRLTVMENVLLPLCYHRTWTVAAMVARVERLLEATELLPMAHSTRGLLKPAHRQRVGLARALAMEPELLLLDDPLAGFRPQEAGWWREFLAKLSAGSELTGGKPVTLVVTCHDLRPWMDQGKQFALVKQKRWLPIGGREELARCDETLLGELLAPDFAPS